MTESIRAATDATEEIRELEEVARRLEPDRDGRAALLGPLAAHADDFLDALDGAPAFVADKGPARELRDHDVRDEPRSMEEVLDLYRRAVEEPGLKPASGRHLAYIPGGGLYAAALGDFLAAVSNDYAGIRFTGAGAVEMENRLIRWMAELVGYPSDAAGNLASGGSIANLIAVVTAREAHDLAPEDVSRAVVYLTQQAHHCVDKALRIAGLGPCERRYLPMDGGRRMRAEALDEAVEEDRAAGLRPWMVVASAGTTDVGAVDPLAEIGRVARRHGLWYHVDAAYGGFFLLCPEVRDLFRGIGGSDSVVMDPHKGLFLPYGLGAVVIKDREAMHRAHRYRAAYMQDAVGDDHVVDDPAELSPELSKHFRGLRMWLPLMVHGLEPFRAGLREKLRLTRYFHEKVGRLGFETGPEPELSVATYRWVPDEGDADAFNRRLVERIHEDGRVFVSSTTLDGTVWLRLAVLSVRTHLEDVDLTLRVLEEKVAELEAGTGAAEA